MFKLLKFGLALVCVAGVVWFAYSVKLGSRTLVEHVQAIGETEASQELVEGTKQKVQEVREGVDDVLRHGPELARQEKPAENHSEEDRQGLQKLIKSAAE